MAHRTLELTLISAKDLKDVNLFSKMSVYAAVTIAGDHRTRQRTPADGDGGKNPTWNASLRFFVPADPPAAARLVIDILLRSERAFGDRDVGEVRIPVKDLLEGLQAGSKFVSYQVRKPHSSKAKGVLNLSYKFIDLPAVPITTPVASSTTYPPPGSEKPRKEEEPVTAYPAPSANYSPYSAPYPPAGGYQPYPPAGGYQPYPPAGGYPAYPPPSMGPTYGAPAMGYGYGAPQPGGFGYAAVPPKRQKNNLGLGLGAGLLGGALGGMLIGDMFSDGDSYDAGYDAGFDDGSGF